MKLPLALLELLSDGDYHSGQQLGEHLRITRGAVWKQIQTLMSLGIDIHRVPKRGYRLCGGIDWLNVAAIKSFMAKSLADKLQMEVLKEVDSTNHYLLQRLNQPSGYACLAEYQSAGRGRQGRRWYSPFGSNVYLSMLWHFPDGAATLSGLSLAVGVSVVEALAQYGVSQLGLKWPNDIVYQQQKLAGILIDIAGDAAGPCHAVIGIGINVALSHTDNIDQAWVDIQRIIGQKPDRNAIASLVLQSLLKALPIFESKGFTAFQDKWRAVDRLYGQPVAVKGATQTEVGIAAGVDLQGRLLVRNGEQLHCFNHGEVSVRLNT